MFVRTNSLSSRPDSNRRRRLLSMQIRRRQSKRLSVGRVSRRRARDKNELLARQWSRKIIVGRLANRPFDQLNWGWHESGRTGEIF
jgi:hypothetical protein